jgi:putative redox protein
VSLSARIVLVDGVQFQAESGSGHVVAMDGAPDAGGRNLAARPMEMVLIGMGGCTAFDVVSMLRKQRQDLTAVSVELVAERAEHPPKVFTSVKLVYRLRGRRLNRALVERAVALSEDKYCSATAMIRKSAEVTHEIVLEEEPA